MEFQLEMMIEGPVEAVFHACDDDAAQLAWIGSLVEVRFEPGSPRGVGSTFVQVHEEAGRRRELQGVILAHEPCRRIGMRLTHADFAMETELLFEGLGPRTRVRQNTALEVRAWKLKAMRPILAAAVGARLRDDFQRLKALVESGSPA